MAPKSTSQLKQIALSASTRGTLMFLSGLGLTIREALIKGPERPSLYVLFAGMMGLPFVWGSRDKPAKPGPKNESDE